MDRYKAVTEYLFDWRMERVPSCEDMVFCRETGTKDEEEEVEALDGACSIATDMSTAYGLRDRKVAGRRLKEDGFGRRSYWTLLEGWREGGEGAGEVDKEVQGGWAWVWVAAQEGRVQRQDAVPPQVSSQSSFVLPRRGQWARRYLAG